MFRPHTGAGKGLAFPMGNGYLLDMETLNLLEQRVLSLLDEVERLRVENARLRDEVESGLSNLAKENQMLKDSLDEEQRTRSAVLGRLDALLLRLNEHATE